MFNGFRIGAILLMSGSGNRMLSEIPKQFLILGEKKVYQHTLDAICQTQIFDEIILVTHPDWIDRVSLETSYKVVKGASTRQDSSYIGLQSFSQEPDIVLVHDAVRPFVSAEILMNSVEQTIMHGAVDTCIPSSDTLVYAPDGKQIDQIPKRSEYLRGQTPQTFRYQWLLNAHQQTRLKNATDDCSLLLEQGMPVHIITGDDRNFKITTKFDIDLARFLINNNKLDKVY